MAPLSQAKNNDAIRILYIGNSGSGKTGSLVSLVQAGYKLRILDMDNGVGVLKNYVMQLCPDKIDNVDVETRRDIYQMSTLGPAVKGRPKAYGEACKLLDQWSDGTDPSLWDRDTIFVLDTLSALGRAAFAWAASMNPGVKDPRQIYKMAQDALINNIANLTGEAFNPHVIVCSHVRYNEEMTKGWPNAIGKAIGPDLPSFFNNLVLAETSGAGKLAKRKIKTVTTGVIDLKSENPFEIEAELPLETGMATIFEKLRK